MWRRAKRGLAGAAVLATLCASASCARERPPARAALDCRQVDGWIRPFHREFLIDRGALRAWGDQANNGIYEIDVRSSSPTRLRGETHAKCPPNDPESCRVRRVVSYDFDLAQHRMTETMRNDIDGSVVQTLHYDCASLPPDQSLVARKLAEPASR